MEYSRLVTAFDISSLKEYLGQSFLALKAATAIPPLAAGKDDLSYLCSSNSTVGRLITSANHGFISTITNPNSAWLLLDQNQLILVLSAMLLLGTYFLSKRTPRNISETPTPSYRWPEHPFPLIHATTTSKAPHQCPHYSHHAAKLMASTHNTILRGLNAIHSQSFYIRPNTRTATSFLKYSSSIISFLQHHHSIEERLFFPAISAATTCPNFTSVNTAQHRAFDSALEELYLYTTTTPAACFSPHTLRTLLESLAPVLTQHLHDEIPSILSLHEKIPSARLKGIYNEMVTAAERESDPFIVAPLVFGCQDRHFSLNGEKFQFPEHPLPLPLIKLLVEWVISWRHRALWQFAPCTLHGEPRRTAFCARR